MHGLKFSAFEALTLLCSMLLHDCRVSVQWILVSCCVI